MVVITLFIAYKALEISNIVDTAAIIQQI